MARPIKETPILRGKDAEDFLWHLDHPTSISNDEKVRAYSAYKTASHNSPNCSLFK